MRKIRFISIGILLTLAVPLVMAQGRRSGGGMQGQGGQGSAGMQGGQNQPPGMGGQTDRQRMRSHVTQPQQSQYRTCTQSMDRVRSRIREMARLTKSQSIDAQQALQLNEQLRNSLEIMQKEQEELAAGLDDEQKATAQDRLLEMARNQEQLEAFSETLGFELEQASLDEEKVRDQVRKMDRTSKQLQQEQRELATDLELQ